MSQGPRIVPISSRGSVLGTRLLWIFLVLVLGGVIFTWAGTKFLWKDLVPRKRSSSSLPSYGEVADFTLTDQLGRTVTRADFTGRPWIADFVFTHCAGPCPLMTAQMARMADSLGADAPVRFASFSVDPERDTPAVLKAYSENYGADASRWHFLTGERRKIADLARNSFHLAMEDPQPRAEATPSGAAAAPAAVTTTDAAADSLAAYDIPHSLRFTLVDATGRIRGYYDGTDDAALSQLYQDLKLLVTGAS